MLVADNRAYDYSKKEYAERLPVEPPSRRVASKPAKKHIKKQKPQLHIFSIVFAFSVCIFILSRYAYIAEFNYKLNTLNNEFKKVTKENTDLNVQLMKTVNLENLEKTAIERLNMQYPDVQRQIVYVDVKQIQEDNSGVYREYSGIRDIQENKYIAYTKGIISTVLKLLD